MSSHREAPAISRDPVADNTDTYAFVSSDDPGTVTIIANYLPLEAPFGGPNFFEFGDDVRYRINIDNDGDGDADIVYEFAFETRVANPDSFLYNTGPIDAIDSANWNRKQFYSITRIKHGRSQVLASDLACPPCNVGVLSTPNYDTLAAQAVHSLAGGRTVFAGQRLEGFYVDLGSIFDLGNLRPFENLHIGSLAAAAGVNATNDFSVHSIALKVPKQELTRDGSSPSDPTSRSSVIGAWASASRQTAWVRQEEIGPGRGCRCRASAILCSTKSWSGWGSRTCGTRCRLRLTSDFSPVSSIPSWPRSCPSCTRACSRTWRSTPPRARTSWRSC